MPAQKVSFAGANGIALSGRLHAPVGPARAHALFAHCFTCSKEVFAAVRIATALAERGIATLRFDFTGLGESAGDFADTHFSSNVEDLLAAAEFMRTHHRAPAILIGHSLGGAAVLQAAGAVPECRAVATIGAPSDPAHVEHLLRSDAAAIERDGSAEVSIAGRMFRIRRDFLEDIRSQNLDETIAGLRRALLVMHAPRDATVGLDNARKIYETAQHPKSFVSLDGADHLLTRREDAVYVADVLTAWASKYLDSAPEDDVANRERLVVRGRAGSYTQEVVAGSHRLVIDEPERLGGDDLGPTPYDALLASLGACTNITVQMYAQRKKWALEAVETTVGYERVHAKDGEDCGDEDREGASRTPHQITKTVSLAGALDEDQRARLLEIAGKCPVHRLLTESATIVSVATQ